MMDNRACIIMLTPPILSVVATVYNDAVLVPELVREIQAHCHPLGIAYEIVLVDDGSSDGSDVAIREICGRNPMVRGITLARNFGQQTAVTAGLREAKGDFVVIMDGDLQNPPEAIPLLYDRIRQGFDIVYTVSKTRNDIVDRWTSMIFWFVVTRLLSVRMIRHQLMMKIMTRRFVDAFLEYRETFRVVAGIAGDIGMRSSTLQVENRRRRLGKGHYSLFRRFELFLDLAIGLSTRPLNLLIYVGAIGVLLTAPALLFYLYRLVFGQITPGLEEVMIAVIFFGAISLFSTGLLSRYLAAIHVEVRNRPLYFIRDRYS